jgi:hypothetical protein
MKALPNLTCYRVFLQNYKKQVELLSSTNSELKSQVAYFQESLARSDKSTEEQKAELESQAESIRNNEVLIETLKGNTSLSLCIIMDF